jgi:hypothetical protein
MIFPTTSRLRGPRRWVLPLVAAAALLLLPGLSRADFTVNVQSVIAAAGSSNNALDITLTNSGPSAITVGGFAFEITTASSLLSFTAVNTGTTTATYIFNGHSLFGPDISNPPPALPGQTLDAADDYATPNQGFSVAANSTVGLGHVIFDVSSLASPGPISIALTGFPTSNFSDAAGRDITTANNTQFVGGTVTVRSVPEPTSLTLVALGGAGLVALRLRCQRRLSMTISRAE